MSKPDLSQKCYFTTIRPQTMGRLFPGHRQIGDFSRSGDYLPELIRNHTYALLQNVFVEEDAYASLFLLTLHKYRFL